MISARFLFVNLPLFKIVLLSSFYYFQYPFFVDLKQICMAPLKS